MSPTGRAVRKWWATYLRPEHSRIGEDTPAARALRARLRRPTTALEVLSERAVYDLVEALPDLRKRPHDLAQLASVLAAIKSDSDVRLAVLLGRPPENGERPRMAELRFQRLIRSSGAELETALRRALPLAGDACDVAALAVDMLDWPHPERGERVRINWCFDYFGAARPASAGEETREDATA